MTCSILLRAAAVAVVVAVLSATAGASSFSPTAPLPSDLLLSTPFLWITANVIIVCLFVFSYRHHTGAVVSSSSGGDVSATMDGLFELDLFAAAPDAVVALDLVSVRQPRQARTAKNPAGAPRVRKKSAGEDKPTAAVVAEATPGVKMEHIEEVGAAATATASEPAGTDDVSMDSAWQSIVRRGAARPVAVRKSETWGGEELPRMRRAADTAVSVRREMQKSASMVPPSPLHPSAASSSSPVAAKQGWRTRDVLVMAHDELLHRAESFIRRQHEQLRIQRQLSDQRHIAMDQQNRGLLRAAAPIRV
ncbi:uncharacterized protein LOC124649418 [Lolium rigidum]|uniref:uncharacterized protein LOC124649418 n=1 Tax=Lolium rigidum TaxID=89674 RepID=UPI001F5D8AB3|nr:uncharacterized protein LOC124649418 [Lolium rigidum]